MPPGLSLISGALSGTPTYPGNFMIVLRVTDSGSNSLTKSYPVTIDNATGQAPAFSLSPKPIQVYHELGSPAPASVPLAIQSSSGTFPFVLSLTGVPGASLDSSTGTTSAVRNLNFNVGGLSAGTYIGLLAASAPGTANQIDSTPVTLTVAPAAPCEYAANPSSRSLPAAGAPGSFGGVIGSFNIVTDASCNWTTAASASWITITSSPSGTGAATLTYTLAPNANPEPRTGTISVNGAVHQITQFISACAFTISPQNLSAPATGGPASISITASASTCGWTASGLSAAPASGTGSSTVMITIPANASAEPQVLSATIAGQPLTVTQAGAGCTIGLSPYGASQPATGGQGSITIATPAGCGYETVAGPNWISVTSGGSGSGSGTLVYSVAPNSTTVARSGTLAIGASRS
jgi:hypothetical protein